jgi:hypothetical protein
MKRDKAVFFLSRNEKRSKGSFIRVVSASGSGAVFFLAGEEN